MVTVCKNFIAGSPVESGSSAERLDVFDPATGEVIAELPLATEDDVEGAVESAWRAYEVWSRTTVVERARVLFRFKQKLEEHRQELADP